MPLNLMQHPPHALKLKRMKVPMPDLQFIRKKNLRVLIAEYNGPTALAKLLKYSGPSYLSQMVGPHKPITEKTARAVEKVTGKPTGWLDIDHEAMPPPIQKADTALLSTVVLAVSTALDESKLRVATPTLAELIALIYEDALAKGAVDTTYLARIIKMLAG